MTLGKDCQLKRIYFLIDTGLAVVAWFVLALLITLPPWFFGGVRASAQLAMSIMVAIGLAATTVRLVALRRPAAPITPILIPLCAALALGFFQMRPLGESALERFSPTARSLWQQGLEIPVLLPSRIEEGASPSIPESAGQDERYTVSLFPASTRQDMALLSIGIGALLLANLALVNEHVRLGMLILAAVNGAALSLFGIVQQLTFNGLLFWKIPLRQGGLPFSSYVNRNNAAGYLLICLGAAFAFLIWGLMRKQGPIRPRPITNGRPPGRRMANPRDVLRMFLVQLDDVLLGAIAVTGALVAGIVCSLSRGANLALVLTTLTIVFLAHRMKWRLVGTGVLSAAALAGVGLAVWLGRAELLRDRFSDSLVDEVTQQAGRLGHWRVLLDVIPDFWRCGSGLGTYRFAYQPYESEMTNQWFYHAENQYLESLVEGGVVGFTLLLATLAIAFFALGKQLKAHQTLPAFACAAASLCALLSQAYHAFFDFGLYMPANLVLLAIICGQGCITEPRSAGDISRVGRWIPKLALILVCGLAVWAVTEHRSLAALERIKLLVQDEEAENQRSETWLATTGQAMERAIDERPDDASAHQRLAANWIRLYRVRALDQIKQQLDWGEADDQIWKLTSSAYLHRRISRLQAEDDEEKVLALVDSNVVRENLLPALSHMVIARRNCAVLPKTHLGIAELAFLATDSSRGTAHIHRAAELAPCDPSVQFRVGLLQLQAGENEAGIAAWRRCIVASQDYAEDILQVGQELLGPVEVFDKVLAVNPERIVRIAERNYQDAAQSSTRQRLAGMALKSIEQANLEEPDKLKLLARIALLRDESDEALELFKQAIKLAPTDTSLRYEASRLLLQFGFIHEAHQHAVYNVRAEPNNDRFSRILARIERQRANRRGIPGKPRN